MAKKKTSGSAITLPVTFGNVNVEDELGDEQ